MERRRFCIGQTFLLLSFIISTALSVISGTHESQPFLLVNEQGVFPELPGTPHLLNPSVNSAPVCSPPLTYLLLRDLCASACMCMRACVCVLCTFDSVHHRHAATPRNERYHQIPGNWDYRQLWTSWCKFWELNPGPRHEHWVHLPAEQSLQPLLPISFSTLSLPSVESLRAVSEALMGQ